MAETVIVQPPASVPPDIFLDFEAEESEGVRGGEGGRERREV